MMSPAHTSAFSSPIDSPTVPRVAGEAGGSGATLGIELDSDEDDDLDDQDVGEVKAAANEAHRRLKREENARVLCVEVWHTIYSGTVQYSTVQYPGRYAIDQFQNKYCPSLVANDMHVLSLEYAHVYNRASPSISIRVTFFRIGSCCVLCVVCYVAEGGMGPRASTIWGSVQEGFRPSRI